MDIMMRQTLTESINGGRTTQSFVAGGRYLVPDHIGQLWIGRGWAVSAPVAATTPASPAMRHARNGKE